MKGWIERWIILPLFIGCKSKPGVAIASTKCPKRRQPPSSSTCMKLIRFRKPSIGRGIHRLIRRVRNISPVFSYRDEEEETEMEIGFPTDVKHLTHIGIDGSITTIDNSNSNSNSGGCWENMKVPETTPVPPSISHDQLEMAMAAQASCANNTLKVDD